MPPDEHSGHHEAPARALSSTQRWFVLGGAFAGWMFAGLQISLFVLVARTAMRDLLPEVDEAEIGEWFAWFQCAFLLGAASGGWLFGWLGDRIGRARALGASILCYSLVTAVCCFVDDPYALVALLPSGMSCQEAAVRFALSHPAVTSAIIGFATPDEVDQAVRFVDAGPLDASLLARLNGSLSP